MEKNNNSCGVSPSICIKTLHPILVSYRSPSLIQYKNNRIKTLHHRVEAKESNDSEMPAKTVKDENETLLSTSNHIHVSRIPLDDGAFEVSESAILL